MAFNEESYGEIVLHPPPLSYLCLGLLPFLGNKEKMKRVTKNFSLMMFWIENSFLLLLFAFYELILIPFAYLKTLINILTASKIGFFRKTLLLLVWFIIGIFLNLYLLIRDCRNMYNIFRIY